jgi:hypothetical protein
MANDAHMCRERECRLLKRKEYNSNIMRPQLTRSTRSCGRWGEMGGVEEGGNKGKNSWCRSLGWNFFVVGHGIGSFSGCCSLQMTIARDTRSKPRTRLKIYSAER